jgi:hypothetical protein
MVRPKATIKRVSLHFYAIEEVVGEQGRELTKLVLLHSRSHPSDGNDDYNVDDDHKKRRQ